jgi:Protein of unknown function (DUF3306)
MSDRENFLARWSRRKRAASDETPKDGAAAETHDVDTRAPQAPDAADPTGSTSNDAGTSTTRSVQEFDRASLPSLDSITADTDIRGFFAPGVPPELTRAALRRAWSADPNIRDFVGLAENSWDFNDPGAVPGFGPLEMTPELRREVARIVGRLLPEEEATEAASAPASLPLAEPASSPQAAVAASEIAPPTVAHYQADEIARSTPDEPNVQPSESVPAVATGRRDKDDAATQQQSQPQQHLPSTVRRGHGGALPK